MKMAILYGVLTALALIVGREIGSVDILWLQFSAAAFFVAPLVVLRDIIQEYKHRRAALIAIVLGSLASYLVLDMSESALILAAALFWSELVDFGLYTYFRKFGWFIGMIISDIVATPCVTFMYYFLARASIEDVPYEQILAKYILVLLTYVIVWAVRFDRHVDIPAIAWRGNA